MGSQRLSKKWAGSKVFYPFNLKKTKNIIENKKKKSLKSLNS